MAGRLWFFDAAWAICMAIRFGYGPSAGRRRYGAATSTSAIWNRFQVWSGVGDIYANHWLIALLISSGFFMRMVCRYRANTE